MAAISAITLGTPISTGTSSQGHVRPRGSGEGLGQAGGDRMTAPQPTSLPAVLVAGGIVATVGRFAQWYFGAYSMYPSP